MRLGTVVLAIGLVLTGVCCSGDGASGGAPAVPGTLGLSLSSPNSDDGAVLLTITGGPIDSVISTAYTTYSARIDANTRRVVVAGNVAGGILVRIKVPDMQRRNDYTATVTQVAARGTYALRPASQYLVTVVP